jgi:hypothetical protein
LLGDDSLVDSGPILDAGSATADGGTSVADGGDGGAGTVGDGGTDNFCSSTQVAYSDYDQPGSISGTAGTMVTVTCNDGYSGGGIWTCGMDGLFSGTGCTANACSSTQVANSNYAGTDSINGATNDIIVVSCDTGYSGGGNWTCGADGSFSGTGCTVNACAPTEVPNSSYSAAGSITGTTGMTVSVTCDEGYSNGETLVWTCGTNGNFSGTGCLADACAATEVANSDYANPGSLMGRTGDSWVVTCDGASGYIGGGQWACGADGVFTGLECTLPPPNPESSCMGCHAPIGYDGTDSIEDPHVWASMACVTCHGGNGEALTPVFAHVCAPPEIGTAQTQVLNPRAFFLSYTHVGVQFLEDYTCMTTGGPTNVTPLEWLAFVNPGDLRAGAAGLGCGSCHADINTALLRGTMGNATGIHTGARHGAGIDNKYADRRGNTGAVDFNTMADYGAAAVTNPDYNADNRQIGEVADLQKPEEISGANFLSNPVYSADSVNNSLELGNSNADNYPNGMNSSTAESLFQEVLNQACAGCHLQGKYRNNRAGDYRSAGCTACHFETTVLGRSSSNDAQINKDEPFDLNNLTPGERPHIKTHRMQSIYTPAEEIAGASFDVQGVGNDNCIACHNGSNYTVAQYEGYRLDQNQDLTNSNFYPSNNTVTFTYNTDLMLAGNTRFSNRNINQWIETEIWQSDVNGGGQDETPADVHHEAGMGCIDCHGLGSTHNASDKIYSRMKAVTHNHDVQCETCHGTIDAYAENNGTHILMADDTPMTHTNRASPGEFWLVSKVTGNSHYIVQVKDVVNATEQGLLKKYPNGASREGDFIFDYVGSYAMGRYQTSEDLTDGFGPLQGNNSSIAMSDNFSHSDGRAGDNKGLECYTCHAAWQNNCIGCHLDAYYDQDPSNFFYSFVSGEQIYFNYNANFVYQNPINFMMGINDRGKISPYQGLHRFFSYADLNNDTSNRISYGDRNGLGNDPQLSNSSRNTEPALQNQPFTPHSIRGRYTTTQVGGKGCLDCHLHNSTSTNITDQANDTYNNFQAVIANSEDYAAAIPFNINMAYGLGSGLWLFDADGNAVSDTANAAVYNLDRIVESDGTSNTSSNHPLFDPSEMNEDYADWSDTNNAKVARPLTGTVLNRMKYINETAGGLGNVYYYNSQSGFDPAVTGVYAYFLNDYAYAGQ